MPQKKVAKNKVSLSDYNSQRDIDNRVLMAELSVFEVDVLKEILDSSLQFPVAQLANAFHVKEKEILAILNKLSPSNLVKHDKGIVTVDKEMRKYYESQILKFDEEFQPNMEFLQGLLSKVPIHVLPTWYAIPCSSDNIFTAIVENYLRTPRVYESYLHDLHFNDPVLDEIKRELFESDELKLCAKNLIRKYKLTREQFEQHMLHLEYNFVGCLGYQRDGDMWEEIVIPFHEWRMHLETERLTLPKTIDEVDEIIRIKKAQKVSFEENHELYGSAVRQMRRTFFETTYGDRDIREVERSLSRVLDSGWVYLEDFLNDFASPIGNAAPITFTNRGKRWSYVRPNYSDADTKFIKTVLVDGFAKAGVIELGQHDDRSCFCVTKFGRSLILA